MPTVSVKGAKFKIRWTPEWDQIILSVGNLTRYNQTKYTDWKKAMYEGAFSLLPGFITVDNIRRRCTVLRSRKNPKWVKKQLERSRKFYANRALKPNGHQSRIKRLRKLEKAGVKIEGKTLREREESARKIVSLVSRVRKIKA